MKNNIYCVFLCPAVQDQQEAEAQKTVFKNHSVRHFKLSTPTVHFLN